MSFAWNGSWEFDEMSGTGNGRPRIDGRLDGKFTTKCGGSVRG